MGAGNGGNLGKSQILGLDIGSNSVGWGLVEFEGDKPAGLVACGVRAFDAGVEGSMETGREESLHTERRQARQRRRQLWRQSNRMENVAEALQDAGLLPAGDVRSGASRHALIVDLDRKLLDEFAGNGLEKGELSRKFPYVLRANALDESLSPHALGRAFYHLAQRRGFLSNRKDSSKDDESGQVKSAISGLAKEMEQSGARTLGEYLSTVDPVHERRIRKRWTARKMYEEEFARVWEAQQPHHPQILTDEFRNQLFSTIFYQRPLKSQKGLIGRCELEPGKRRAALALLPSQRFRMLQKVNDLEIRFPDGTDRELDDEERAAVVSLLEEKGTRKFTEVRKHLKLPKGAKFNLEEGGETKIPGNETAARLRKVFGARWDAFSDQERSQIVSEVLGIPKEETVQRRGREVWGLNAEEAVRLSQVRLERGYCAHSKEALKKLVPLMEERTRYATAKKQAYGEEEDWVKLACEQLPPVAESGIELRNPAVMRALTETRKVVNHLIKRYGKPDKIRIELARDLRRSAKERQNLWKKNRDREKERKAAEKALKNKGVHDPRRDDVDRYLLAEECNWHCPYTGRGITWGELFGEHPAYDIEHIWPFSRSLDNSFLNRTLCYHEENRSRKGNRTPYEAYHGTEAWEEILARVADFSGDAAREKLRRFQASEIPSLEDFASRQLNDTRYASRLAARYLGLLYGDEMRSRVEVTTGQITAQLRNAWKLNAILSDGAKKSRDDHRHHAIDAIVTAMVDRRAVKAMSEAAQEQFQKKGRTRGWWNRLPEPWETFNEDVESAIEEVVTSHRVNRRVRGRLHEDTNYTAPRTDEDGNVYVAVRKPLNETFKQSDVEAIIDPVVRDVVQRHLDEHGGDSKKAFGDPENHPKLTNGLPIHRVRIKRKTPVFAIGKGGEQRQVSTDTNHHVELFATNGDRGTKWRGRIVSLFEAYQRAYGKKPIPVVERDSENGDGFVFSLGPNECVEMDSVDGKRQICRVRGISEFTSGTIVIDFQELNDARPISKVSRKGRTRTPQTLFKSNARKVTVSPLGEVLPAND